MAIINWVAWYAYLGMAALSAMWAVIVYAEGEGRPIWPVILRLAFLISCVAGFTLLMSIAAQNPAPVRWGIRYWFAAAETFGWIYTYCYLLGKWREYKRVERKKNGNRYDTSPNQTT